MHKTSYTIGKESIISFNSPKNICPPVDKKIVKKLPPIFHFQEWESVQISIFCKASSFVKIYTF